MRSDDRFSLPPTASARCSRNSPVWCARPPDWWTWCVRTAAARPPHIGAAFILWLGIYGSVAAGTETARSDVDVMILGELPFAEAVKALAPARASLRREVNPTVMKSAEFLRKRLAKDNFVTTVWIAPRLWVIGSDHELG